MKLESYDLHITTLINILKEIYENQGDLIIGYEDNDSYTNKTKLRTNDSGDLIFDISR